jgi:hypothetical protein
MSTTSALVVALDYIARGWNPLPLPYRTKRPTDDSWQNRVIDADSAPCFFNGGPQNIGVVLGPSSHGLTDVDLDAPEAIVIAPYLLPPTPAIFGRPSKRASHWLYKTNLSSTTSTAAIRLRAPAGATLIELRIGGDRGAQTVFPGSTHESGEPISWEQDGQPATVIGSELLARVKRAGAACLIAGAWPAPGGRHDAALAVGGFFARAGLTTDEIKLMAEAIARAAGDPEWPDRVRTAVDSARMHASGGKTFGLPKLIEIIGEAAAVKVADWVGYRKSTAESPPALTILTGTEFLAGFVPPNYLIDGVLQRRFLYALTGQTGHYKTAVALRIMQLVCSPSGGVLAGHAVTPGRAAYLVGENPDDVRMRVIGDNSIVGDAWLANAIFVPGVFNTDALLEEIEKLGLLDLLIIDTSAAYFLGEDENSNKELGDHARKLRHLISLPGGPCCIALCHPIKYAAEPSQLLPRGGGSFLAEVDGNLTLWRDDQRAALHHTDKFRGPGFASIPFRLEPVTTGTLKDSEGRLIPTIRAVPISDEEEEREAETTHTDENKLLVARLEGGDGMSITDMAHALGWLLPDGGPARARVQRRLANLKKAGLIKPERGKWELTPKGEKLARKLKEKPPWEP